MRYESAEKFAKAYKKIRTWNGIKVPHAGIDIDVCVLVNVLDTALQQRIKMPFQTPSLKRARMTDAISTIKTNFHILPLTSVLITAELSFLTGTVR
jgi:hypothetical protein